MSDSEGISPAVDARQTGDDSVTFTVEEQFAGTRLDAFLAERVDGWSRSRLQKLIEDGDALVGGKVVRSSYKLRAGDVIEADLIPAVSGFEPENIPLEIVHEDDYIIVVNKPAGLVVHPAAGVPSGTLANALAYHFSQLSTLSGGNRPGIVHRLDRDTSGLMVVAKTGEAHERLADQFRDRTVFKSYSALVYGVVKDDKGRVEAPIARDPKNRAQMGIVKGGRPSLSLFKVVERLERFTLLDVEIKTGRTHQIRVHLAHIKHPVAGDKVYGAGRENSILNRLHRAALSRLDRQFLHAGRLGFQHPKDGRPMKFELPLPLDLAECLSALRLN